MDIVVVLLNLAGLIFLTQYVIRLVKDYRKAPDKLRFFTYNRFRYLIILGLLIGTPVLLANFLLIFIVPEPLYTVDTDTTNIWWVAVGLALLISAVWVSYVQRLDIYEPERWVYLLLTFVLACLATEYLCPLGYRYLASQGIILSADSSLLNRFLYCVFVIGGIEEVCKILPVLIVLLVFRKAIDEPYDYILYGSVAALGFAFIENIQYIYASRLYNIGGRALYAAVAHMTFTSTICYGLMLWRFDLTKIRGIILIPLFFLLAIGAHGFYDFWLLNGWEFTFSALTTLFFLITVHLWVTMKNNALNVSNYFDPAIRLDNDRLRQYLIVCLTGLMMLGYLIVALLDGRAIANEYLLLRTLAYGYLIFYLAFGLSRYRIIQHQLRPLQVPFDFFIPKPRVKVAAPVEQEKPARESS